MQELLPNGKSQQFVCVGERLIFWQISFSLRERTKSKAHFCLRSFAIELRLELDKRPKNMDSDSDYNPQTFEKKVNRSKPKQKRVRFSTEMKIRMIQLYERRPCLWDTKHLDYWNRIERSKAEKEIAALLKHPEALVNARWQVLRNEFRIERNRVLNGRETNKPYESKWPFYHHLEFLNNHSNRPYKLNKRRSPTQMVGYGVSVKRDVNEVGDDLHIWLHITRPSSSNVYSFCSFNCRMRMVSGTDAPHQFRLTRNCHWPTKRMPKQQPWYRAKLVWQRIRMPAPMRPIRDLASRMPNKLWHIVWKSSTS